MVIGPQFIGSIGSMQSGAALQSKRYVMEDPAAVQEFLHGRGWTDGLPVVPPTGHARAHERARHSAWPLREQPAP